MRFNYIRPNTVITGFGVGGVTVSGYTLEFKIYSRLDNNTSSETVIAMHPYASNIAVSTHFTITDDASSVVTDYEVELNVSMIAYVVIDGVYQTLEPVDGDFDLNQDAWMSILKNGLTFPTTLPIVLTDIDCRHDIYQQTIGINRVVIADPT